MNTRCLYQELAALVQARLNCIQSHNSDWEIRHSNKLQKLCENFLPHGSGFDSGTAIDLDNSKVNRIILNTSFHHMDEYGGYDGWTDHQVIITPSLISGFDLRITGRDRDGWKEYAYETFDYVLNQIIDIQTMELVKEVQMKTSNIKLLTWGKGLKIRVLRIIEGPDTWGLIRIEYKVIQGKNIYTLWCYPENLKEI